jgi:transcriptional regulator with XRE-family HTH domain
MRFGSDVRLLRRRLGWSQRRLALEAGASRWSVAEVEAGRGDRLPLERLIAIIAALRGYLSVRIMFQGEGMDRLRDRKHAALVDQMVGRLKAEGWEVATEVTFNHFGERGSIDIFAFHPGSGTVLVVEVKSVVPDVGGMLAAIDRKVRLAADIARGRGWRVERVARLLVLPELSTARRRVLDHEKTFANSFPARNVDVNAWLRSPTKPVSGLIFLSAARDGGRGRNLGQARTAAHEARLTLRQRPADAGR